MKDKASSEASNTKQNGSPAARDFGERKEPVEKSQKSQDLREIRDIVSRYVGQLVDGCGSPTCTETLCDTGRRNNSQKPVRRYTPRSARAIAITLVSGPRPRSHICPKYKDQARRENSEADSSYLASEESPRDPSAFVQQLSDSPSARRLCIPPHVPDNHEYSSSTLRDHRIRELNRRIQLWHEELDKLNLTYYSSPSTKFIDILAENEHIVGCLAKCIKWLVSTLPSTTPSQRTNVAKYIGDGCAYPGHVGNISGDDRRDALLTVLDSLEYGPSFRLFRRVVALVARRAAIERSPPTPSLPEMVYRRAKRKGPQLHVQLATLILEPAPGREAKLGDASFAILWLEKIFLRYWDGEMRLYADQVAASALMLLEAVHNQMGRAGTKHDDLETMLAIPAISQRLDAIKLVEDYLAHDDDTRSGHLLNFHCIFTTYQKVTYFRTLNHLQMRKAHSDAEKASTLRSRSGQRACEVVPESQLKYLEDHYLLLNVSRGNVLQDAFDQLWQRRRSELLRPLRVRLGEMDEFEIGHDLGGVQIEFFNLVCKKLFREDLQIFTTDPSTGLSFFRPGSLQPLYMFELCGLLFALALYNGITLPVSFPDAFYHQLLGHRIEDPDSIRDGWPSVSKSLKSMLEEEIPGLDASLPLEANGLRLTVSAHKQGLYHENGRQNLFVFDAVPIVHHDATRNHHSKSPTSQPEVAPSIETQQGEVDSLLESIKDAWPGWHLVKEDQEPDEVTPTIKTQYIQSYIDWLSFDSISPQFHAFKRGFATLIPSSTTRILLPRTLRALLEGEKHLDLDALRRATVYDGYDPKSRYIQHFWRIVASWSEEKQKLLVKFVTATERIPTGGAGNLTFKVQRMEPVSAEMLPSSSTCFGTLMLPKYGSVEVLERKLGVAIEFGAEGFGSG